MERKWHELAPFYFHATATAPLFFTLAPPRHAPPFSVRASSAVALKVAQVPSRTFLHIQCLLIFSVTTNNLRLGLTGKQREFLFYKIY